jgi:hypothetical protein
MVWLRGCMEKRESRSILFRIPKFYTNKNLRRNKEAIKANRKSDNLNGLQIKPNTTKTCGIRR